LVSFATFISLFLQLSESDTLDSLWKRKPLSKDKNMQLKNDYLKLSNLLAISAIGVGLLGCEPLKDDNIDTSSDDTAVDDTGVQDTGNQDTGNQDTGTPPAGDAQLQGVITGPDGHHLAGVTVRLGTGESTQSDASGQFSFVGIAESDGVIALFEKDEFMSTTRIFDVVDGPDRVQQVNMIRRANAQVFDAGSTVEVELQLGTNGYLVLEPESLVNAEGAVAQGQATAYLTMINVQDRIALRASPGDFQAKMADGSSAWLESFGMSELLIVDAQGEELFLADGKTAELAMDIILPIGGRGEASQSIPFLIFDEATGLWVEEGTGTTTDWSTYVFPIDEFGHWNADQSYNTTCVKVRVEDSSGNPVSDLQVEAMGLDYTNYQDYFTNQAGDAYMLVRRDSQLQATVYDQNGAALAAQNIATPNVIGDCVSIEAATGVPLVATFSL